MLSLECNPLDHSGTLTEGTCQRQGSNLRGRNHCNAKGNLGCPRKNTAKTDFPAGTVGPNRIFSEFRFGSFNHPFWVESMLQDVIKTKKNVLQGDFPRSRATMAAATSSTEAVPSLPSCISPLKCMNRSSSLYCRAASWDWRSSGGMKCPPPACRIANRSLSVCSLGSNSTNATLLRGIWLPMSIDLYSGLSAEQARTIGCPWAA